MWRKPRQAGKPTRTTTVRSRPAAGHRSQPRVEIQQASTLLAAELGVEENAPVVSRHQERSIDGTPWSLQTSFYPMTLVERGALRLIQAQNIPEGTVAYLSDSIDINQAGYRDVITVRAPDGPRPRSSSFPTMAGSRWSRRGGPRMTSTAGRSGSR